MRFIDLWRWNGRVNREAYAVVGIASFIVKHLLDGLLTWNFLGNNSGFLFNYWAPLGTSVEIKKLTSYQTEYLGVMLLTAIPFIWLGVAMTAQRLRDAGWHLWLAAIFFVPVVNVAFLVALCFVPSAENGEANDGAPRTGPRALDRIIPRSQAGGALLAILLASIVGLAFLLLGTVVLQTYGWSLFIALPFCMGLFSVLLYSYHEPRELGESVGVALLPVVIVGMTLLFVAMEGLICILMAAPFAAGLAALGGLLGYSIQSARWISRNPSAILSAIVLIVPATFGVERTARLEPPQFMVRSAVEINAPPERVWKHVVAFAEIAPPGELLFRAGIAYPIRAEISGRGAGAVRRCVFSTGPYVEPIEVWDEPRLLRFGVSSNPPPLNEWTPYGHIEPRHLHGYFESKRGQFLLEALPGGRTRLEGTTWYRNAIWPSQYWRLWSDYIIHRIHCRVLEHIKKETEDAAGTIANINFGLVTKGKTGSVRQ
jgi:uncharacterized membrane protein YhaH (DUF805 family)